MKKCIVLLFSLIVLAGCGSGAEKTVTCTFDEMEGGKATAIMSYDDEKTITQLKLNTIMEVPSYVFEDKDLLKNFKESMQQSADKKSKLSNVSTDLKIDEKKGTAELTITIDQKGINKDNADEIGFHYTTNIKQAIKQYEANKFECTKLES